MKYLLTAIIASAGISAMAQSVSTYTSTEGNEWTMAKTALSTKPEGKTVATVSKDDKGVPFVAWGTCFNELGWDAFNLLERSAQNELGGKT